MSKRLKFEELPEEVQEKFSRKNLELSKYREEKRKNIKKYLKKMRYGN